jgi:hypothetical protein
MAIKLSPKHTIDEFKEHWDDEDKIEVYLDRIMGWQLSPAHKILEAKIINCDIAVLSILISYFEMIGKYEDGYVGKWKSKYYFKKGLLSVFPTIEPAAIPFMESLYENLRCGLSHSALPTARVIIENNRNGSIGYNEEHNLIIVNVELLLNDIALHYEKLEGRLRDKKNVELRQNVIKRFDSETKIVL